MKARLIFGKLSRTKLIKAFHGDLKQVKLRRGAEFDGHDLTGCLQALGVFRTRHVKYFGDRVWADPAGQAFCNFGL